MKNREAPEHAADEAALPKKDHIPETKRPESDRTGLLIRPCRRTESRLRVLTGFLLVPALLLAGACGSDLATDPDPSDAPEIPWVTLTPAEGPPGTIVVVESPVLAGADVSTLGATIGGYPAPIRMSVSGEVQAVIPILAAGERGDTPPDEPVTVELLDGDETIARSELAFTVTVLPNAPGAADSVREDLTLISGRLSELAKELDLKGSASFGYAEAILGGLEALLVGDPEESLAAQLERLATEDPETLALVEGVLAASGAVDATRKLAEALASVSVAVDLAGAETAAIQPLTSPDGSTPWATRTLEHSASPLDVDISDVRLASKMQFYVVAKLLGETVVGETAEDYAATVGLVSGALGMGVSIPAASLVGAILGVANFAVNKVFLGVFPAELSRFDLVLEDDQIEPGDTTTARFDLEARNAPPEVGIQDFISLTLDLIGIAQGVGRLEAHDSFRQVLQHTAAFYLTTIRSALAGYASEHPELNLDVSFELIPDMTWTAVAHDPRLVDVLTHTPDVVTPLEDELNWHAAGPELGEGRIYARTATGDDAVLIDLPPGFTYTGGAFGENVLATETRSVYVVGDLVLEVDFPETITDDDIVALEVRAGHHDAEDEPVWKPGIEVSLIVDGGTVEHSEGVTDGDGQFITLAQLLPESDRIIITVVVRDDFNQEAVQTVEAAGPIEPLDVDYEFLHAWVCGVEPIESLDALPLSVSGSYQDPDFEAVYCNATATLSVATLEDDIIVIEGTVDADAFRTTDGGVWTLAFWIESSFSFTFEAETVQTGSYGNARAHFSEGLGLDSSSIVLGCAGVVSGIQGVDCPAEQLLTGTQSPTTRTLYAVRGHANGMATMWVRVELRPSSP